MFRNKKDWPGKKLDWTATNGAEKRITASRIGKIGPRIKPAASGLGVSIAWEPDEAGFLQNSPKSVETSGEGLMTPAASRLNSYVSTLKSVNLSIKYLNM